MNYEVNLMHNSSNVGNYLILNLAVSNCLIFKLMSEFLNCPTTDVSFQDLVVHQNEFNYIVCVFKS